MSIQIVEIAQKLYSRYGRLLNCVQILNVGFY